MQLSYEILNHFVGGQIEIQNRLEGYLYRGEIAGITIEGEGDQATLKFTLAWFAQAENYPEMPPHWVSHDDLTYEVSLLIYQPSLDESGRLHLQSFIIPELMVVFPPGGSRLDPAQVEGLVLASS